MIDTAVETTTTGPGAVPPARLGIIARLLPGPVRTHRLALESRPDRYCSACGRELVDVAEPFILFDNVTGQRPTVVWRQCPRFPRSWRNLWLGGDHVSFERTSPTLARRWPRRGELPMLRLPW